MGMPFARCSSDFQRPGRRRWWSRVVTLGFAAVWICSFPAPRVAAEQPARSARGLVHLYEFNETSGTRIHDSSGSQTPLHLRIEATDRNRDPLRGGTVKHLPGGLRIASDARIVSEQPATALSMAAERTGALTIEAWVTPRGLDQQGPARIVTLSSDPSHRNFTLGQEGQHFDGRLRTTETSDNGIPSLAGRRKLATARLVHIVYTRGRDGIARLYVDGQLDQQRRVSGALSNWNRDYHLALGDELSGGRPWQGTLHLVAIYARDLSSEEIGKHFAAGPKAKNTSTLVNQEARLFETQIAPLLAEHCLECHDAAGRAGGLDLAHRKAAFQGDSGTVIEAGDAPASLLLQRVLDDSMPHDRPPLSAEQKALLRQWIDRGAPWTLDFVDPALYVHGLQEQSRWVRRLTVREYINTVDAVTGVDIAEDARQLLPRDLRADGFSNTAYNLNVDLAHVEAYAELARRTVDRLDVAAFARRFSQRRKFTDKDMGALIEAMGKWVLRGPLTEREIIGYRGISTSVAASGGDFDTAVGLILQAMLQSPRFLYLMENQIGDGTRWPVTPHELASRISYMLWGGPPDAELYELAASGRLAEPAVLGGQVDRMLEDPRARRQAHQFAHEWLHLAALQHLQPSNERFPTWRKPLAADMRAETLAFFDEVAWQQDRPLPELLTASVTFLTAPLAEHYGMGDLAAEMTAGGRDAAQLPPGLSERASGRKLYRIPLSDYPQRGGLLTHGSVLTVGGDDASTVTRGLFVLHQLLRGVVKDPPPCVDTTPRPAAPGLSRRDIALTRINDASCGGCHSKFEPLAFALERFDGLGTYQRRDEHDNALRQDGEILFPGTGEPVAYETIAEFAETLASHRRVAETLTWKLCQFALGRPLTAADAGSVAEVHRRATAAGGSYRDCLKALIQSDLVLLGRTELLAASPARKATPP